MSELLDNKLSDIFNNKYVTTGITILLGLYLAMLGPNLPKVVRDLFNNTLFRITVLFLILVKGNNNPSLSIMIAAGFILTLDYIHVMETKEAFQAVNNMSNDDDEPMTTYYDNPEAVQHFESMTNLNGEPASVTNYNDQSEDVVQHFEPMTNYNGEPEEVVQHFEPMENLTGEPEEVVQAFEPMTNYNGESYETFQNISNHGEKSD